jgi:GNAT superfamily N-acetyltransferase
VTHASAPDIDVRHYGAQDAPAIREVLLDIHDEVYDGSDDPLADRAQFAVFADHWSQCEGFACAIGYTTDGEPVGYAYGAPLSPDTTWWTSLHPHPGDDFTRETGERTFALSELMVRTPWRKTGAAHRLHDALLAHRTEQRVTLLVHQQHPKVVTLYTSWGYHTIGATTPPFPGAPDLYAMVLPLRS